MGTKLIISSRSALIYHLYYFVTYLAYLNYPGALKLMMSSPKSTITQVVTRFSNCQRIQSAPLNGNSFLFYNFVLLFYVKLFFHTYFRKLNVLSGPFIFAQYQHTSLTTDFLCSFCNFLSSFVNYFLTLFL
jgi:hypothetical protein